MSELGMKLITDLREIVAEHPEHIDYQGVYLAEDGSGGCGVGRTLVKNGIINASFLDKTPITIDDDQDFNPVFPNAHAFDEFFIKHYLPQLKEIDVEEAKWLRAFQEAQDGMTGFFIKNPELRKWINAVQYADKEVPSIAERF